MLTGQSTPDRKPRQRIFRENYHLESGDLMIDHPFQGQPSESCGHQKKPRKHENAQYHPNHSVARTRTIKCVDPSCPNCNILWNDLKNRIPYLSDNKLVPSGWWGLSVENGTKRIDYFQKMITDDLEELGYSNNTTKNKGVDDIITDYFPKSIPRCTKKNHCVRPDYCSFHKLHNILWHMLKSGESLRVYHVVMSPPQDHDYVSDSEYKKLKAKANSLFIKSGGWGGMITMHHARVVDKFNNPKSLSFKGMEREDDAEGFHFHAIGFGFFDYESWKGSGWVIKNLSYNPEKHHCYPVQSISGAMEYVLEHCSIVSRKVSNGSLSCETAVLTASGSNHSIDSISYGFDRVSLESDTDSETNEIELLQPTIESGVSETAKKLRKYDAYWYVGCLAKKNFKVPKKRPICPVGDHEIEKGAEKPFDIYVTESVSAGPEYVTRLEFLKSLDIGDPVKIDSEIVLAKEGKLKVREETMIDPLNFDKYFQRVYTKSDNVLRMVESGITDNDGNGLPVHVPDWLYESCKRRRLSDPNYKWWSLPHSSYVLDVMQTDVTTTARFRMETTWKWE